MTLQASKRFLSLATAAVFCANIILSGCAQKTAQNTSQAAASPSPGGLGNILGGSAASSSPTSAADSGGAGCFRNVGGAAGCAADILNSNGQTTPRQVINQTIERYKLIADNVPKSDFSVSALADTLPSDANLIDQWVRDKIRLDIYPGAMRGALGAILGRAANPTDKASLLAALLQRKGMQVRFARSTLTDAEAATLAGLVTAPAPTVEPITLPDTIVAQLGISSADIAEWHQKFEPVYQRNITDGVAWGQKQADKLLDILSRRSIDVASASSAEWAAALRPHYWVQVSQNGSWADLDPSAPSLQPGQHLGKADPSFSAPALPDDVYQALKISVIATFSRGGSLQDQGLLTAAPKVVELVGQPLEISILPEKDVKTEDLGQVTTFQPMISIGDREFKGTILDLQKDGPQLAEVRVEIQASAPGRPTQTYRRWVFDRRSGSGISAMSNDALARGVATLYQGLVAPGSFNESFVAKKTSEFLSAVKPALIDGIAPADQQSKSGPPLASKPYPIRVLSYFVRDRSLADALEETQSGKVRLYQDRPDIAFVRLEIPSSTVNRLSFDIVENAMATAGGDAHAAARLNVARGILDTRVEQVVMSAKQPASTMGVFKAAHAQGINQWVLAPADVNAAQKPALGQQTAESLQDTLRAGQAAVAIERPVAMTSGNGFGWWAIDPKSGSTVGRMSGGAGTELSEYAVLVKRISVAWHAFIALAECSGGVSCGCIVAVVETVAAMLAPGAHAGKAAGHLIGELGGSAVITGTHAFGACAHGGGGDHGGGGGEGGHGGGEGGGGGGGCGGYSGGCSGGVCGGG